MALHKFQSCQNNLKILSNKARNKIIFVEDNPLDKNYSQINKKYKNKTRNDFKSNFLNTRNNDNDKNMKCKNSNEKHIVSSIKDKKGTIFILLECVILLNLFNPILSYHSITIFKKQTSAPNEYDPIINIQYIGRPNTIYLNGDVVANETYFSYQEGYLKFNCTNIKCIIKLEWSTEVPINTYHNLNYNNEISEAVVIDTDIGEEVADIDATEMFKKCDTITNIDFTLYETKKIVKMNSMFESCTSLTEIVGLSLKNVEDFSRSYKDCISLTEVGINDIEITNDVLEINMEYMFSNCTKLIKLDWSAFNLKNIISVDSMFLDCVALNKLFITLLDILK